MSDRVVCPAHEAAIELVQRLAVEAEKLGLDIRSVLLSVAIVNGDGEVHAATAVTAVSETDRRYVPHVYAAAMVDCVKHPEHTLPARELIARQKGPCRHSSKLS